LDINAVDTADGGHIAQTIHCRATVACLTQSFRLYDALRDNGVAYPVPGHSPADPVHARDVDLRWVGWFAKYLAQ